jgi:hypothetical protein
MIGLDDAQVHVGEWDGALLDWQNNTTYMPMITAAFGLSRDYDDFLLGLAGPLVALMVAASRARGTFGADFCGVLVDVLRRIGSRWQGFHAALWTCHVAARLGHDQHFETARSFLNDSGGVSETLLVTPPSSLSIDLGRDEIFPPGGETLCPSLPDFQRLARTHHGRNPQDPIQTALRALDDDSFISEWANDLLGALWGKVEDTL